MTYEEKVRSIWPGITEDEAGYLLMNVTCYPFGPDERVFEQLQEAYAMSGGDIEKAVEQAHEVTERGMRQYATDGECAVDLGEGAEN